MLLDRQCHWTHVQWFLTDGIVRFDGGVVYNLTELPQAAYNGLNGVHGLAGWRCESTGFGLANGTQSSRAFYHRRHHYGSHRTARILDNAWYVIETFTVISSSSNTLCRSSAQY